MVLPSACYFGGFSFWFMHSFPGQDLLLDIIRVHLLGDCVGMNNFIQMTCLSLCCDFQPGGAGVLWMYRKYGLIDVRPTHFKVYVF